MTKMGYQPDIGWGVLAGKGDGRGAVAFGQGYGGQAVLIPAGYQGSDLGGPQARSPGAGKTWTLRLTTTSARCRHPGCTARPRNRRGPVKRFLANVQRAAVGGQEFVRARVEMKAVETSCICAARCPPKSKIGCHRTCGRWCSRMDWCPLTMNGRTNRRATGLDQAVHQRFVFG